MLIKLKPNTPGQRGTVLVSKKHLSKDKPYKTLTKAKPVKEKWKSRYWCDSSCLTFSQISIWSAKKLPQHFWNVVEIWQLFPRWNRNLTGTFYEKRKFHRNMKVIWKKLSGNVAKIPCVPFLWLAVYTQDIQWLSQKMFQQNVNTLDYFQFKRLFGNIHRTSSVYTEYSKKNPSA